jgi:thioesterase domain-containing protein/acyl carrier protein
LHIGGPLLARGYHQRPELTAAKFIANPFSDEAGARLYKTGDLVRYLEDGNLEFLGRIDDQVKIRGFRIELGEIENCLRTHPKVREAVVLTREDKAGEKRLAAYVEAVSGSVTASELNAHIRSKLPDYMVPSALAILERLPIMPSGKIDRRALPEPDFEALPEGEVRGPEDPLELQLQLLFERVLRRAPIGVDASFFELGGDSLQALELLVQIEKATGKQLPLGTLYHASTVQGLAQAIRERAGDVQWSSLVPLQASGRKPPLYFLHTTPGDILGYGNLVYRLGDEQPCHGFQSLGLKDERLSHLTVGQMADYYVQLLREQQPHGPYYLAGWCYGGILAVEIAQRLKASGEEIGLLALLETVAPPAGWTNWRYAAHRLDCFLRMTPRRWMVYLRAKLRYLRESKIANRMRFRQVDQPENAQRDPRLARLEQVYNTNLQALESYRSRYYDGKVVLFNAAEQDMALIPDPQYGWVGLARAIEIHEVPGNHDTMLTEPNVSALAEKLSSCLAAAHAKGGMRA